MPGTSADGFPFSISIGSPAESLEWEKCADATEPRHNVAAASRIPWPRCAERFWWRTMSSRRLRLENAAVRPVVVRYRAQARSRPEPQEANPMERAYGLEIPESLEDACQP